MLFLVCPPKLDRNGALFAVDMVASAFATEVNLSEWCIDLALLGTQKVLGMGPDLGIVCVSDQAWPVIHSVNYEGYEALAPFHKALPKRYFPYTPNWRAVAVLHARLLHYAADGNLEKSYDLHARAADDCRRALVELGEKFKFQSSLSLPLSSLAVSKGCVLLCRLSCSAPRALPFGSHKTSHGISWMLHCAMQV